MRDAADVAGGREPPMCLTARMLLMIHARVDGIAFPVATGAEFCFESISV